MRLREPILAFLAITALGLAATPVAAAPGVPTSFAVDDAAPGAGFQLPTSMAFLPDGRFFVTEKRGRVWEVRNGVKRPTAIWSAENEVLDQGDRGLLAVGVDPNYYLNHFIYFFYVVDPDSNGSDSDQFAFDRLTRYTVNFTDSATVIASSRRILIGVDWPRGVVSCSNSHTCGAIRWGADGSLLLTVGDGAHYEYMDDGGNDGGAFTSGRTNPNEDIGSFRAQDITSLAGKVLRINPATGNGYMSNPYRDSNLASVRSRVWCYGLRNPFRFTVRPGTGVADTAAANPGTIYIGDVGYNTWEEMNVAAAGGGKNFGWPCYEGLSGRPDYQAGTPAHNGCGSFGSATNPTSASLPLATWNHTNGSQSTPPNIVGNCSIGGVFCTSPQYPAQYRNQYFYSDYGQNWVRVATVDVNNNLVSTTGFLTNGDGPVDFAVDPVSKDIFYCAINGNQVRRIRYTGAGSNNPPVAQIAATPLSGQAPLSVQFSSAGSADPDGDTMSFNWVFADGTGSQQANPTHLFNSTGIYTVQLTVSDGKGGTDIKYITISVSLADVPFPATAVLDAFNRANGAIGSPWVDQTSGFTINSNALAPGTATSYIEWNGATFGADQEAYVTFNAITATAPEHNLMLKTQGTTWTAGHIEVCYDARTLLVTVYTYAPNSGWVQFGQFPVTFAAGDRFGARALRDGSVQVYKNSTRIGITSVTGWPFATMGGRIGFSHDNATASRLDNFGGGTVVLATNTPPVASITAPPNNSFYYAGQTITLVGTATDQSPMDSLQFNWNVDLHHNNHIHPSFYHPTGSTATIPGENHDDGTGVHLEVKLAVIDPQGAVSDTSKITLWPETDLVPSAVTVSPDPPQAGQPAHFTFTIANNGRMLAPISHWTLRAGNTVLAQGDTLIGANAAGAFSADAALPTAGTQTLRLKADSLNVVFETNESNNASVRSLTVAPAPGNNPPVAAATGAPTSGQAPLTVNFSGATSTDANGDSLTFAWTFGDGGTATGRLTSHAYTSAGSYAAVLTVNDGRGGVDTASVAIGVTGPAGGFPQTGVLDNFNRANGAPGSNWVDMTTSFAINSNTLDPTNGDVYIEWNGGVFGADQEAFVTLSSLPGSSREQNLMLKTQGTAWSTGHIEVAYDQPNTRVVVSTFTPPGTWVTRGTITGVTFAAGNQFGARALANGTVTVYKNGAAVGSVSVSGWAYAGLGGRIGLSSTNATSTRFDNFGGGNASSNTPPTVAIASPTHNSFYYTGQTINLSGSASDVQTPSGPFTYSWFVDLLFGSHVQPSFLTFSGPSASYAGADYDDGTGVRQQIEFVARDPQGAVSDTGRVTIWPEIDLTASAVTVAPDPPVAGQSAHYTFSVTNNGRMPAQPSRWVLRAGSTLLGQGDASVPASGSTALAADATLPNAVTTTLRLRVDSLATVFETSETNNASVRALTVAPAPGNNAPVAAATGAPTSGQPPLTVNFSGATSTDADGDSLTFAWTFGDGGTATGRLASHAYTSAGSYAAILTVNDGRGGVDTASVAIGVTPPPAGFPLTAVLDNFNRANGAIGSNWVDQTASYSINGSTLAPGSGDVYVEWNGTVFGANQEVFVTLSALTASAPEQNLMLKTQGTTWTSGHLEVSYNQPTSRVFIYTFTPPGTWTTRGTLTGVTFAAGNQFGARALANGTVTVYKNGTAIGSASVASWAYNAQGGRIGVSVGSATSTRFDDFGGGNVPAAALIADGGDASLMRNAPAVEMAAPSEIALSGAFPNPTSGGVTFSLALPREATVRQTILDIQGREVWSAAPRQLGSGRWTLTWDGRGTRAPVTAGVYLARVEVGERVFLRRFAIVR